MPESPRKVLVSACLMGRECRYDGRHNRDPELEAQLAERGEVALPFCPEEAGGLSTPRPAAWIESTSAESVLDGGDRLVTEDGTDVTEAFRRGAQGALEECRAHGILRAYLKERSPSCGVECTHVAGALTTGPGVTAALLAGADIEVIGVDGRR